MAGLTFPAAVARGQKERVLSAAAFDWVMTVLSIWLVTGLATDVWAHSHVPQLETFFTPWHGVLYSGFGAIGAFLVVMLVLNHARGFRWQRALPAGYALSLVGAEIFAVAGIGDLSWHTALGIERNDEILFSPTHLLLLTGGILMTTGVLRAAWLRKENPHGALWLQPLLSVVCALTLASLPVFVNNPFSLTLASALNRQSTGQFSAWAGIIIMFQTVMLMGTVLLLMRRWSLPFGAVTVIFTVYLSIFPLVRDNGISTGALPLVAVAALAGLAADCLIHWLKPSINRPLMVRVFAFITPVLLYGFYLIAIQIFGGGVWWSLKVWPGVLMAAGLTGLALSYIAFQPRIAAEAE